MNILGISFILYEFAEFWRFDSGVVRDIEGYV